MNLEQEILRADFKDQAAYAAEIIGDNDERFVALMKLFFSSDSHTCQRASWVVLHCIDQHPTLIVPHLKKMVNNLYNNPIDAVKRNTIRALQFVEIPKSLWGKTIEICFQFLQSSTEPIAIKVFSMSVLYKLSQSVPEIKEELKVIIEDQLPYSSAGFRSRGSKVLKKLNKEMGDRIDYL